MQFVPVYEHLFQWQERRQQVLRIQASRANVMRMTAEQRLALAAARAEAETAIGMLQVMATLGVSAANDPNREGDRA
jgi:hypothetical protein